MTRVDVVIVDIETTGLDQRSNLILEIGMVLCDAKLNVIDELSTIIPNRATRAMLQELEAKSNLRKKPEYFNVEEYRGADIVWQMHKKSGLADEILNFEDEYSLENAEAYFVSALKAHDIGGGKMVLPMTGSSVHFDRKFLEAHTPELAGRFHHRNIDVSTLKGVVDIYRPDLHEARKVLKPAQTHRAISDCKDTIEEYRFYLEHVVLAKS